MPRFSRSPNLAAALERRAAFFEQFFSYDY
jgi:hypothetical protein